MYVTQPFPLKNPFRFTFNTIQDHNQLFRQILEILTNQLQSKNQSLRRLNILLIFSFLTINKSFYKYFLKVNDPEILILPLLEILYTTNNEQFTKNTREIYYILVNLLLVSQDQALVSSLASIQQQQVKWIDQIKMNDVSVQSLVIFVLIKVMKQNLEVLNDEYLQSLLNGILFNVSQSQDIHQAVNISFLDFMVLLVKKKTKAKEVSQLILDTLANLQKCLHKILGFDQGNLNQFSVDLVYSILNNAEDLKQTDDQYLIELIVYMEKQISLRNEEDVTSILSKEIGQFRCNKVQYNLRFVYEEDEKCSEFSIVPFIWQIYLEFQDEVDEKKIKMFSK